MRMLLVAVLSLAIPISVFVFAGDNGYKVTYDGGSLTWIGKLRGRPNAGQVLSILCEGSVLPEVL